MLIIIGVFTAYIEWRCTYKQLSTRRIKSPSNVRPSYGGRSVTGTGRVRTIDTKQEFNQDIVLYF